MLPGTLMHIGRDSARPVKITIIDYDEQHFQEKTLDKLDDCIAYRESSTNTWLNISGIHDQNIIQSIGDCFQIHPLVLEDIMNTNQRPKLEDYGTYYFVVLKMLYMNNDDRILGEQVSIVLGPNYLLTFQEDGTDVFELIRDRLRNSKGRLRKMKCDYLMYSLIDAIVDQYFIILEKRGDRIEEVEESALDGTSREVMQKIQHMKRDMGLLRSSIWPLRDITSRLEREESDLISKGLNIYFRDVYDHTVHIIESLEAHAERVQGLFDIYLLNVSNRMNEVMKILAIFGSIFIPLTFIASIYGMNFDYMPELHFKWSYPVLLTVMFAVGMSLAYYFKKKGWY